MGKKRIITKSGGEGDEEKRSAIGKATDTGRKTSLKKVPEGRMYIYSSYNNTLISLTDTTGNVLAQMSAGALGFKGTKKSTPFAASKVADALAQIARNKGMEKVEILVRGIGSGRDSALRSLGSKGFEISSIRDITPIPHNGPRPRKVRRV